MKISAGITNPIIKLPVKIRYIPPKAKHKPILNKNNVKIKIDFLLLDVLGNIIKSKILKIA